MPLIPEAAKASFATDFPQAKKTRSIAVAPNGLFYYHAGGETAEDATRRSLKSSAPWPALPA